MTEYETEFGSTEKIILPVVEDVKDSFTLTLSIRDKKYISNEILLYGFDGDWLMKITPNGQILFNREANLDLSADEFAREVVHIIEHTLIKI